MDVLQVFGIGLVVVLAVVGLGVVVWMSVTGVGRVKSDVDDLVRIKREAHEASWAIHQRATSAFTAMLAEARTHNPPDPQ